MQTPSIDWQGKMLGRYRLRNLLGRGGMGEVWLADDTQLRRQVALKMLPAVYTEDHDYLRAFMQEARTAASLEHPHILPVHDFGEEKIENDEIITYLVMPHVAGGSLREHLQSRQGPLPMAESLRYLRQAAQAIDYAHSKQVLHRDIKPANMLLQQDWLLLADFGIAKILNETKRSRTNAGAGTPEYMAPEQAQGHAVAASDLYSMAIIAYQMLTGSVPFRGKTPYDTLMMQISMPPDRLRNRQPSISADVEMVVLRGLAKQPAQRQLSCTIFVNELEQALQLNQNSVSNPGVGAPDQPVADVDATMLAPWSKRSHAPGPIHLQPDTSMSPPFPPTIQAAPSAGLAQTQPSSPQAFTWTGGASQPISEAPYPQAFNGPATNPAVPGWPAYPPPPTNNANYAAPSSYPGAPVYPPFPNSANYPGYPPPQSSGAYSPAPTYPPTQNSKAGFASTAPAPGTLTYISEAAPAKKKTISRRQLLIGGVTAGVVVVGGGVTLASVLHKNPIIGIGHPGQQTPQGISTPVAGPQQLIKGIPLLVLSAHNAGVNIALWHPKGRYLASAGSDGNVMLWDINSYLKQSNTLQTISTPLNKWKFSDVINRDCISWSNDGKMLAVAVAGENNKINIVAPLTNKLLQAYTRPTTNMFSDDTFSGVAWSPAKNILASTIFFQGEITLFDANHSSNPLKTLKSNDLNPKTSQAYETNIPVWSLDGRYLAGQTNNFKALIWDVSSGNILQTLIFPSRSSKNFVISESIQQWSPKSVSQLAVVNLDAVQIWDALKNKLQLTFGTNDSGPLTIPPNAPDGWVPHLLGLSWSPNGRYLAGSYARSNLVYIWDTQNPVPSTSKDNLHVQNLYFGSNGHSQAIDNLAWSPDGRYIATTSTDKTVIIWQVDAK